MNVVREQQQQPKPKPGGGIEPPEGTSPGHIPKPGGGTWRTNRHEEAPRNQKSCFGSQRNPEPQHAQTTREDTDQGGRSTTRPHALPTSPLTHTQTTESDLTSPMSAFGGCSSSPAQLTSGPAPAATASEAVAGRFGHRTGMPAAPDAAAPASAAASGRQRSCKGTAEPSICE